MDLFTDRRPRAALFALTLSATLILPAAAAAADPLRDAEAVVSAARRTLGRFQADPEMSWFRDHIGATMAVLMPASLRP